MKKIFWVFNHLEELISSLLLFTVFILLGWTVIGRTFGFNVTNLQEIVQYGFIIGILFGISYAAKEREHIRADILIEHVSEQVNKVMLFIADIVWFLFSLGLVWFSFPFIKNMIDFPQATPLLQIPFWILYLAVPISGGLTCIRIIQTNEFVRRINQQ